MSAVTIAPPTMVRLHRAPLLDPPFDDELTQATYRPQPEEEKPPLPPGALAGASPECHAAALRFLTFCLELLNGFRTPAQVRPLLAPEHLQPVTDELTRAMRRTHDLRKRFPSSKIRRSQLRTCEPAPGIAEAAAVLNDGQRAFALCFRLERHPTGWRCHALKLIL
jgi:hypothetical protein